MGFDRYRRFGGSPLAISSGGDGVVSVADRLAGHVASARPQVALRASLAASSATALLPRGAGAGVDATVARLRPVAPVVPPVVAAAPAAPPVVTTPRPIEREVDVDLATIVPITAARRHPSRVRKVAAVTAIGLAVGGSGLLPAAAIEVDPGSSLGFEQDGNFADAPGNTAVDWTTVKSTTTVINDDNGDIGFQGSSKEEEPGGWTCQTHAGGVTPGKDNLLRAYVNVRFVNDRAFLDLGLVKEEGEGDTHVNFEFNRDGTQVGECGITRQHGDFMVTYDFGGTSNDTALVRLFKWDAPTSKWIELGGIEAEAANNTVAVADTIAGGTLEARTFVELTVKLPTGFLTCPGFAFANVRSRSAAGSADSNSIRSALQDRMPTTPVDVSSCASLKIHKQDELGNPLGGAIFGLYTSATDLTTKVAECTTGADGSCTFSDLDPGDYFVREIAAPPGYAPDPTVIPVTLKFRETKDLTTYTWKDPLRVGDLKIIKTREGGVAVAGIRFYLTKNGQLAKTRTGANAECTTAANGTCTIEDLVPGDYTLNEDASTLPAGMLPDPSLPKTVTIKPDEVTEARVVNPLKPIDILLTKDVNKPLIHPGDEVTYTLTIKNTGGVDLTLIDLTDEVNDAAAVLPGGTCAALEGTTLAAGAAKTCTYDATLQVDTDNVATVVGQDAYGRTDTSFDDATVDVIDPDIALTKLVNGVESVTLHTGDATNYAIRFENTGDTDLTITSFTDSAFDLPSGCDAYVGQTLAPGDFRICEYATTAPTGGVTNTATVVGEDALDKEVTAKDTAVVKVIDPLINIVKTVNGGESATVHEGDEVTYQFRFQNTGTAPLTITSLTDVLDDGTNVSLPGACTALVGTTVAPGAYSPVCTYTAEIDDDVVNTVTVKGEDALGGKAQSSDTAEVDVLMPEIQIVKTVDKPVIHAGDQVVYTLVISNIGNADLTITSLTDKIGATEVNLPAACDNLVGDELPVGGEPLTCTYTANPTTDTHNVATVVGEDELGLEVDDDDDADVDVINPDISIVKTVNGLKDITVHAGDPLTYLLTITNTGDTALELTSLEDVANDADVDLPAECDELLGTTLVPNAVVTCEYTTTATVDVDNVATVVGEDELGKEVDDDDEATVDVINPAITIVKTVNGEDAVTVHPGDELTYDLVITNTGDTDLTITALTDLANDQAFNLPEDCTGLVGDELAVGDSVDCSYTTVAGEDDVHNVATVVGEDELEKTVTDDDDADVTVINPDISIVKTINNQESVTVHAGDTVTYRLYITNTGDTALTITSLTDVAGNTAVDLPAACDSLIGKVLAVGASVECSYTAVAGANDLVNVATVEGEDELDKKVKDDDDARYDVINPAITIVKTGTPTAISGESGEVTFTYLVTNTGDTELLNVKVTDDILGEIGTIDRLEPGQSATLTKTATVSSSAPRNVGTATGRDRLGKEVTANDDEVVTFALPSVVTPAEAAPAPAPIPRTGVETGRMVQIALVLMILGGLAVLPERLRLKRSE